MPFFRLECLVISAIQIQSRNKSMETVYDRIWIWPFTLLVWWMCDACVCVFLCALARFPNQLKTKFVSNRFGFVFSMISCKNANEWIAFSSSLSFIDGCCCCHRHHHHHHLRHHRRKTKFLNAKEDRNLSYPFWLIFFLFQEGKKKYRNQSTDEMSSIREPEGRIFCHLPFNPLLLSLRVLVWLSFQSQI